MKLVSLFFCSLISLSAYSQDIKTIDSLLKLTRTERNDSQLIRTYIQISDTYWSDDPENCEKYAREAYQIALRIKNYALMSVCLNNLSAAFAFRGQIDKALEIDRKNIEVSRNINDTSGIVKAYNNIAEDLTNAQQFVSAEKYLDTAFRFAIPYEDAKLMAKLYMCLGNMHFNAGKLSKAVDNFLEAARIADNIKDTVDLIAILGNLSTAKIYSGKISDSVISMLNKCLAFLEVNKNRQHYSNLLSALASAYFVQNNYGKAIEVYKQAKESKMGIPDSMGIAEDYLGLAVIYSLLGNIEGAKEFADSCFVISKSTGFTRGLIASHLIMGNCFTELAKYDSARILLLPYFSSALKDHDVYVLTFACQYMGNYYYRTMNYDSALACYNDALNYAVLSGNDNYRKLAYFNLASTYNALHLPQKSYEYLLRYVNLNDTIQDEMTIRNTYELETKYKSREKDTQIKVSEQAKEKERQTKNYFIYFTIGLTLLSALIAYLLYNKRKQNDALRREQSAVANLIGIMQHETTRQFHNLEISLNEVTSRDNPDMINKAILEVKSYALLYRSLFISSGKAVVSFKRIAEELFLYNTARNLIDKSVTLRVIGDMEVDIKGKEYLFLYLNELMGNSLEHAFTNQDEPEIVIDIRQNNANVLIEYADNGSGIKSFYDLIKPRKGLYYVLNLAEVNLNGKLTVDTTAGVKFLLSIPTDKIL